MIDPEQLQLLARFMEQYHLLLQTAQETNLDPKMRAELQSLQTFLRDTHAQFQNEMKDFNSTAKKEIQQLKLRRDEAEKKIAEAAAQRQKQLEELAAREIPSREIDPLLLEMLQSDELKNFGNRHLQSLQKGAASSEKTKEVWQDWPAPVPPPKAADAPKEQTLPDGVHPFARLIDPSHGEELRRQLLAAVEPASAPPPAAESAKDVWQDWPRT